MVCQNKLNKSIEMGEGWLIISCWLQGYWDKTLSDRPWVTIDASFQITKLPLFVLHSNTIIIAVFLCHRLIDCESVPYLQNTSPTSLDMMNLTVEFGMLGKYLGWSRQTSAKRFKTKTTIFIDFLALSSSFWQISNSAVDKRSLLGGSGGGTVLLSSKVLRNSQV